jgi:hypothetical protein
MGGSMKFRKRPVVIEAVQLSSMNVEELKLFCPEINIQGDCTARIKTLEGEMFACEWDWIIKGVKGEFYPCKPDIFEATYEEVA